MVRMRMREPREAPLQLRGARLGRPVVALGRGGALETVVSGETGVLVDDDSVDAFADGIRRAIDQRFDSAHIRLHAERFSRERFLSEMDAVIAAQMNGRRA